MKRIIKSKIGGVVLSRFSTSKAVLLLLFLCTGKILIAQTDKKVNQSVSIMPSIIFDVIMPLGKSIDLMYEHRLWENLFIKGGVHLSNIQKIAGGRRADFRFAAGADPDGYVVYFIGRPIEDIERSFTQNMQLLEVSLNYRFGKRNAFIPELGVKIGSGYEAALSVAGTSTNNGILVAGNSVATFQRNPLFGIMVGFNYAIKLKKGFYLQPSIRFYNLNDPEFYRVGSSSAFSFGGRSFGLALRKDILPKK